MDVANMAAPGVTYRMPNKLYLNSNHVPKHYGPISHPVVKSVVKCMVITRLSKWFGIELHCVSTDRVSDLAAIEWLRSQRLTTGYLVIMGGDQPYNKRS